MIILISGASHTGKTLLAQKLLEKYKFPYLSVDHLKMGLIRSKFISHTPLSSTEELTECLWPVLREILKTAIENKQNLIVEGCYIPFDWKKDFSDEYISNIKFICLVMSENYIRNHFDNIIKYENIIETRLFDESCSTEFFIKENAFYLNMAQKYNSDVIFIDEEYNPDINLVAD